MMVFSHKAPFNPLVPTQAPSLEDDDNNAMRFLPSPLFSQFAANSFPAAAMAQAAQMAQVGALGYPVMLPAAMRQNFNPEMLQMGGGPYQGMLLENGPPGFHPYGMDSVRRKNATRETTAPLKAWLNEHRKNPYPAKGEKICLAIMTHMTLTQVSTWFANARRRLKKENKMTWSPQNRRGEDGDDDDDDIADIEALNRPSSSNSGASDRKEDGDTSVTSGSSAKRADSSPILTGESPEELTPKKSKIWSIADVAAAKPEPKLDASHLVKKELMPTTSEEAAASFLAHQQMMAILRMQPQMMAAAMRAASSSTPQAMMINPFSLFGLATPSMFSTSSLADLTKQEPASTSPLSGRGGESSQSSSPSPLVVSTAMAMSPTAVLTPATSVAPSA